MKIKKYKIDNYYIYIYLDPRKPGKYNYEDYCFLYEPFYVGKGIRRRYKIINKKGRNKYFINKISKIIERGLEPIVIKLREDLGEDKSFILESELIKSIGRKDLGEGPLINFTNGGEGTSGRILSKEELKKKRKNFLEIKKEFERRGYKLLTKEEDYENCYTKLNYICPRGHNNLMNWNNFQRDRNCPICRTQLLTKKQRKNFLEIKKEFERRGYKLLTKEEDYENCYTKLNYICPRGHKYSITWNSFRQGRNCLICGAHIVVKKQKKNFLEIKNEFERRGYKLLTKEEEYKNNKQKLEYICPKAHKYSISWSSFRQGHNCLICGTQLSAKKQRKDFLEIKNEFEKREYKLLTKEKEYKNSYKTKLRYVCDKGHKHSIRWNHFKQGIGCPYCYRK